VTAHFRLVNFAGFMRRYRPKLTGFDTSQPKLIFVSLNRRHPRRLAVDEHRPCPNGMLPNMGARITVPEIAERLEIGRIAVYQMLEQGIILGVRLGRRWIITRYAYEHWERTCGTHLALDLLRKPEVTVN
jgi:excisionase family DNA binding protein